MRALSKLLLALALIPLVASARVKVAATTTFVGDVVAAIASNDVDLVVIFPRDADPHAFEPAPRDVARFQNAQILFENGFGIEASLQNVLKGLGGRIEIVEVSKGISPRKFTGDEGDRDPHVWLDPILIATWATNIEQTLSRLDPAHAADFHLRAEAYRAELQKLDGWIREKVAAVPPERRVLVTDHDSLGYFADRYGFHVVGTVIPGFSTLAEPSARDIAALEKTIRREKVPAIFAGGAMAPAMAERVAADTGAKVVTMATCTLGPEGAENGNIFGFMRTLTTNIVSALQTKP